MKELYLCGNKKDIDKVMKFIIDNNVLGKGKIFLIDYFPELKEGYMEEQGVKRD